MMDSKRQQERKKQLSDGAVPLGFLLSLQFSYMLFKGTDKPGPISKEFLNFGLHHHRISELSVQMYRKQ